MSLTFLADSDEKDISLSSLVKINLIDLNNYNSINPEESNHQVLFNGLKNKMRNFRKTIPFSMKFKRIKKLQPQNVSFSYPSDVKVSPSHNCICVADDGRKQYKFFDLTSFEYLASFAMQCEAASSVIEVNFDNLQNDAIYFRASNSLMKFRICDLLQFKENARCIWEIPTNYIYGMGIRQVGNTKQLFRFNSNTKLMDVIDTLNGKIIKELPMENLQRVVDIKFIRNNRMIVADLAHNKCFIYDEINLDEWKLIRTIEKVDEITLSQPLGFAIDKSGEKFFLSDYDRKRILVFDMDGNCLHSYSENHSILNPFGLDFDERSGLLYISDQQDNSIKVFE